MNKQEIIEQTKMAYNFIEKLYFETSYLVKEIQGLLEQEDEKFKMAQPGGYGITWKSSAGLNQVELWLLKKFSVCFIPEDFTDKIKGTASTKFNKDLKIILLRVIFYDKSISEPKILIGVLNDIIKKVPENKWPQKIEHIIAHIEYNDNKIFRHPTNIDFEDTYIKMKGKLIEQNLFDINNSDDIENKLINPVLKIFRMK